MGVQLRSRRRSNAFHRSPDREMHCGAPLLLAARKGREVKARPTLIIYFASTITPERERLEIVVGLAAAAREAVGTTPGSGPGIEPQRNRSRTLERIRSPERRSARSDT